MLTYFLQVNLCWLLFYGLYYVLLSRETFFKLNRIYLIISLLAGLILPCAADWLRTETPLALPLMDSIMLPTFVVGMQGQVEEMFLPLNVFVRNGTTEESKMWTWWPLISAIYFVGVGLMGLRFSVGLFQIFKTFKTANFEKKDGLIVACNEGVLQPFSFFNFIFINTENLQSIDFQNIMQHEKTHVKQGHSFDVVFLELLSIVFWCSPLIYLYKNSLRIVHEYLADAAVLRSVSKRQYGTLLIQQAQSGKAFALTNPFFSQLKKRIIMMTRNPSKRQALVKYILALPIFLLLVSFLATPDNVATDNIKQLTNSDDLIEKKAQSVLKKAEMILIDTVIRPFSEYEKLDQNRIANIDIDTKEDWKTTIIVTFKDGKVEKFIPSKEEQKVLWKHAAKIEAEHKVVSLQDTKIETEKRTIDSIFTIVEDLPQFPQGQKAMFMWLGQNVKYPAISRENGVEGTVYVGFVVEIDGSISNVEIKRGVKGVIRDTLVIVGFNGMKGNKITERPDYSLDNEAKRVIAAMPKWVAGRNKGQPVRVAYTLPLKFKLE